LSLKAESKKTLSPKRKISTTELEQNYLGATENWLELNTDKLSLKLKAMLKEENKLTIEDPTFGRLNV